MERGSGETHPSLLEGTNGTYALLINISCPSTVVIGRLGALDFEKGQYAYVGSAFGPGGLTARLGRYVVGPKRRHWHIDHLLPQAEVTGALVSMSPERLECRWAGWLASRAKQTIVGFGSSDCSCSGHLFYLGSSTHAEEIRTLAGCSLQVTTLTTKEISEAHLAL